MGILGRQYPVTALKNQELSQRGQAVFRSRQQKGRREAGLSESFQSDANQ
jgi:hypothetical protein